MSAMASKPVVAASIAALILNGCAFAPIDRAADHHEKELSAMQARLEEDKARAVVSRMRGAKLAAEEREIKAQEALPPVFSRPFAYTSIPQPLPVILGDVAARTGLAIRIQGLQGEMNMATMPGVAPPPPGQPASQQQPGTLSVDWNGSLKGLFDHLAMRTGMYWRYAGGYVDFYVVETKTFRLALPPGTRNLASTVGFSATGSGSSGGATGGAAGGNTDNKVSVDMKYEIDPYQAIRSAVLAIIGLQDTGGPGRPPASPPPGAPGAPGVPFGAPGAPMPGLPSAASLQQVAVNPALGTITVTAEPPKLERVEEYIKSINASMARNILIDLKVYNVDVTDGINAGVSLLAAYQQAASKYNINLTGNPALSPSSGSTPGVLTFNYTSPASRWLGSQITLQALQQLGRVTLRTSGQVMAVNGQPTPLQIANEITYLASASTTVSGTVGATTTSLTPGVKTVGLTANFLPTIMADNRILLQYQISLSSLLGIDQISSGGQVIQTPRVATQNLQQQVYVQDGETIVLFGFEQDRTDVKQDLGLGGASKNADRKRSMMVIVMEVYSGK